MKKIEQAVSSARFPKANWRSPLNQSNGQSKRRVPDEDSHFVFFNFLDGGLISCVITRPREHRPENYRGGEKRGRNYMVQLHERRSEPAVDECLTVELFSD